MTEINYLFLIPLLPLLGFLFNGLIGRNTSNKLVSLVGCLAPVASFAVALIGFQQLVGISTPSARILHQELYEWIGSGIFNIKFSLILDPLSVVMALIITGIGSLIHLYSTGYMHEDKSYARYFAYLNLFLFFMLVLVLADNLLLLFVGWEGVGLCSYLLIGFWFDDLDKAGAGRKAFIVNRIGDLGFFIGMALLFWLFKTLNFGEIRNAIAQNPAMIGAGTATAIGILLFIGAAGKSSQIPLYVWLPDAMAGPTPVSALIHAATMVTAGVYMVARMNCIYALSPVATGLVAFIGALTVFYAATISLAQNDIKKVLAYSTISQLGYMFVAVGVGAYAAGIFHLMTHAFFKALLFLGAGAVIHALAGEQDIRRMGGLREKLPVTYWTFFIGVMAIVGCPFLSGFFSKDEIIWYAYAGPHGHWLLWLLAVASAVLTMFYMMRLWFVAFTGEYRGSVDSGEPGANHLHPPSGWMKFALIILAAGSVLSGYVGIPHMWKSLAGVLGLQNLLGHNHFEKFLQPVFGTPLLSGRASMGAVPGAFVPTGLNNWSSMIITLNLLVVGLVMAWAIYFRRPEGDETFQKSLPGLWRLLQDKYRIDEVYGLIFVKPLIATGKFLDQRIDMGITAVTDFFGYCSYLFGRGFRSIQDGHMQTYIMAMTLGLIIFVLLMAII